MANLNSPFGLRPVRSLGAGNWPNQVNTYYIVSSDPNQYQIGDMVLSAAGGDTNGVPAVIRGTAGTETPRGIFLGAYPANWNNPSLQGTPPLDLSATNIPATKTRDYYAMIWDDPMGIFQVQGDATTTKQIATSCNKNASLTIASGPTAWSSSATVIASASIDVTATLIVKLMGLAQIPGNGYGPYAIWNATWNVHELKSVGTLGV